MQWHDYGNHMGSDTNGIGTLDSEYTEGGYTMYYNTYLEYIGLVFEFEAAE